MLEGCQVDRYVWVTIFWVLLELHSSVGAETDLMLFFCVSLYIASVLVGPNYHGLLMELRLAFFALKTKTYFLKTVFFFFKHSVVWP